LTDNPIFIPAIDYLPARLGSSATTFTIGFSLSEVSEVDHFVARGEELAKIGKVLGEGIGRRAAVVHGLGGIGKTQLAAAYASQQRDKYSAVFWLNARDETSLKQSFARVAGRILREHPSVVYVKNAVESRDLDEAVEAVKRWLELPGNDRWLVVCDNYDNPRMDRKGKGEPSEEVNEETDMNGDANVTKAYDIRPFLPESHHGAVLVTTRSVRVQIGRRIPLGKLKNSNDSLAILSQTSGRHGLHEGEWG
jgi:hypothetical protein